MIQKGVGRHVKLYHSVANLETPPQGDGLTPSLAVMLANAKF